MWEIDLNNFQSSVNAGDIMHNYLVPGVFVLLRYNCGNRKKGCSVIKESDKV